MTIPVPPPSGEGVSNGYKGDTTPNLRLLCSITGLAPSPERHYVCQTVCGGTESRKQGISHAFNLFHPLSGRIPTRDYWDI